MEKLLKLLNEYGDINWNKAMVEHQDTYIISKKFGFIKWLVENDKIDYENDILFGMNIYQNGNQLFLRGEDEIVMQLAISYTPIEDLCKLLV